MTEKEILEKLREIYKENLTVLGKLRQQLQNKLNLKGNLRINKRNTRFYYYLISKKNDTNGKYLSKTENTLITNLCQRDYCQTSIKLLSKNTKAIHSFLKQYTPEPLEASYGKLHPGKQLFITPVAPTNAQFLSAWQNQTYPQKPFLSYTPELFTSRGQRVRSKSEIIIANQLDHYGILYHYEKPIKISQTITLHPDFTCLNPHNHQEYIWEHFGIMDDPEYACNAVEKIALYHNKDYILGKNLLVTFETSETPLQLSYVNHLITEFLLQ